MKKVLCTLSIIFLFTIAFNVHAQNNTPPIKILLVPGHDRSSPGGWYANLKEADMNLILATKIYDLLKTDDRFDVHITRDKNGYTKEFADYFKSDKENINSFIKSSKENLVTSMDAGNFTKKSNTPHGKADDGMVFKLYAINKWANVNNADVVIHVHFNDYKRKSRWKVGDREGFTIYIPDEQFVNSEGSFDLADSVFYELNKKYKTSNYVNELGGMVFDQKLIAIGANRTLVDSVKSILVEYGYIYNFGGKAYREKAYIDMADLTVAGVKNYFLPTP